MKEYVCIVCPNGCHLKYDETTNTTTGNKCPRGAAYALSEYTHPTRSICSTVRTSLPGHPVVSVRTSKEIDKNLITDLMEELKKVIVNEYLPINSVVIENVLNTGADIITTTPLIKGE